MIRVLVYLVLVAVLAFGAVWFAERPGDVAITWQGRRIDTSVMVLAAAVAAIAVATVMAWSILRAILRAPDVVSRFMRIRRGERGYRAVSQGLIAVGSGDARAAKKFTAEAARIAPREPLTLLLSAQSAQLSGDRDAAVATFREMADRDDTRVLGLHGLFVEAQRRHDHAAALGHAEEAAKHASVPVWAGQAVLEFRCVAGDWSGALERLERNMRSGLIDRRTFRRQRAVLLTAQAQSLAESDRPRARGGKARARSRAGGGARRAAARRSGRAAPRCAHHRAGVAGQSASRSRRRLRRAAAGRFRAPALESRRDARGQGARRRRGRARGRARRARRAGVCRRAQGAGAVHGLAEETRGGADGRARNGPGRRGPRARMDGARAQRAARSRLDRGRLRVRPLAADLAGERAARRLRVEGSARRRGPWRRHRAPRRRAGGAGYNRDTGCGAGCSPGRYLSPRAGRA